MTGRDTTIDSGNFYTGVIHIHSGYSHDGHDTILEIAEGLRADRIEFCILTDHFEDFDGKKFQKYIAEIEGVNLFQQPVFVPGVEAELLGFHTIFLPVSRFSYDELRAIIDGRSASPDGCLLKFLAHPTKHPVSDVVALLHEQRFDGVEIWNQQADGNYFPPARFFLDLMNIPVTGSPSFFFGSDIHDIRNEINNLLLIPREGDLNPEMVITKLRQKEFLNYSRKLKRNLSGNCSPEQMGSWLNGVERQCHIKAEIMRVMRESLRFFYHLLPLSARGHVNDFKNAVKNRL